MPINFKCPKCKKQFKLADKLAGRRGQCPDCGNQFKIPVRKSAASTQQMRAVPGDPFSNLDYPSDVDEDYTRARRRQGGFFSKLFGCLFLLLFLLVGGVGGLYSAIYFKLIKPDVADPYLAKVPFKIPGLTTGPKTNETASTDTTAKGTSTETTAKEDKKDDGAGGPVEYRFLPDKTAMLISVNVEAVLSSKLYEKLKAGFGGDKLDLDEPSKAELGVPLSGIRRVVFGARAKDDAISVILTKDAITADDIKKNRKGDFTEVKVGKYVMYDAKKDPFCVVNDHTLLMGQNAEQLKKVLERDKPPEMVADLQPVFKQVSDTKALSMAFGPQEVYAEAKKQSPAVEGFKPPPELQPLLDSQAFALHIDLTSGVEISTSLQCKNSGDAEALKKSAGDFIAKAMAAKVDQSVNDVLQTVKLGVSGDAVNITLSVPDDAVANMVQQVMKLAQGMFAPPKQ